jgi:hypothetical protein
MAGVEGGEAEGEGRANKAPTAHIMTTLMTGRRAAEKSRWGEAESGGGGAGRGGSAANAADGTAAALAMAAPTTPVSAGIDGRFTDPSTASSFGATSASR